MKKKSKHKKSTKEQGAKAQAFAAELSLSFAIRAILEDLGDLPRYPVLKLLVLLKKG